MKTIDYSKRGRYAWQVILLIIFYLQPLDGLWAQSRPFTSIYSGNIRGGATLFGNTLLHIVNGGVADTARMNAGRPDGNSPSGNDFSNMQYVDVDGMQGIGAATRNSSSADLQLPAGNNTIRMARLYWGGKVRQGDFDLNADSSRKIKIRFGNGAYREFSALRMDQIATGSSTSRVFQYQACADITSFVQNSGSGTYTVGHAPLTVGSAGTGGNYGGWCVVVVYENGMQDYHNNVRVYDGFQQVYNDGVSHASLVRLGGLTVSDAPVQLRDAKLGAMVWEGDASLRLDYLKINGILFKNGLNAVNNPWNGSITDTGVHVRSKLPDYTNQMGIDIDQFHIGSGYGIASGDTSLLLEFGTESDQFFTGLFSFQVRSNDPTLQFSKQVADNDGNGQGMPGEILTYTLRGSNTGSGKALGVVVRDTLPANLEFVPGSIRLHYGANDAGALSLTDLSGDDRAEYHTASRTIVCRVGRDANAILGGILNPADSFTITFRAIIRQAGPEPVINRAHVFAQSAAGQLHTRSGTAVLSLLGGPLPVNLTAFQASLREPRLVSLNWTTTGEMNAARFLVERSQDGIRFSTIGSVLAAGTTNDSRAYQFQDDVAQSGSGVLYYRLLQVDRDGNRTYSQTLRIKLTELANPVRVYPNPFHSYFVVSINSEGSGRSELVLFSSTGIRLLSRIVELNRGVNQIRFDKMDRLPPGSYQLQCNTPAGNQTLGLIHQ
jgi:uncharacterized repeat protein (TIGR01451 family)